MNLEVGAAAKVSVIIPAFKASRLIAAALDSVAAQVVSPFEILVIDDGSPDAEALASVVSRYSGVRLIRQPNGGAASARNLGIKEARGDWVAFLDADDHWLPEKLATQCRAITAHPEVSFVASNWRAAEPRGVNTMGRRECAWAGRVLHLVGAEAFRAAMQVWTGTVLVRRDALPDVPFESGLEPAEDRDLWFRLLSSVPTFVCPEVLATYVQHPESLCNADPDRDARQMLRVIRRHRSEIGRREALAQEAIVYRGWASRCLARGEGRQAISPAVRRLIREPGRPQAWWAVLKSTGLAARPT